MSLGLSTNGRLSTPTTGRPRCRTRARRLPRRPQMPVTSTAPPATPGEEAIRRRGAEEGEGCDWLSAMYQSTGLRLPKNVLPLFEAGVEHGWEGLLHEPYLLFHD